jgi:structural maintenance of chromosome 3 (chondroitin sulfate proteoglycan 6)
MELELHPGINTLVGANGSGKTSVLQALCFVLSEVKIDHTKHDLRTIIHDSCNMSSSNSYVEIIFDNADGRFPIDSTEIRISRSIALCKDQYEINGKKMAKHEIANILEIAGFSNSNPYFIVRQGEIIRMGELKDHERLKLLKEVGGAKVYEERRLDSMKILRDSINRRETIFSLLFSIEIKLNNLEEQKFQLEKVFELRQKKRCLEYLKLEHSCTKTKTELNEIEIRMRSLRGLIGQEIASSDDQLSPVMIACVFLFH